MMKRDPEPRITRYFELAFPGTSAQKTAKAKTHTPTRKRTALFVPTKTLTERVGFRPAPFSAGVQITHDVHPLLKTVFREGEIGQRYGRHGLERDLSRQQIIIYTLVVWNGKLLFYRRAKEQGASARERRYLGDERLRGRVSVGFGGHKTINDVEHATNQLLLLGELFPGLMPEMTNIVGLNSGVLYEVEEETGVRPSDIRRLMLLGGFRDLRERPTRATRIPVGHVHAAIAALVELKKETPITVGKLQFPAHEVADAWWVPVGRAMTEFKKHRHDMESWSEIMIREFLPRLRRVTEKTTEGIVINFR